MRELVLCIVAGYKHNGLMMDRARNLLPEREGHAGGTWPAPEGATSAMLDAVDTS